MTQPAVELTDVSKRYGEVQALRDVSLKIEPGEVVAMLGPNGAGKTTSISIMLGARNPTSGTARLFGLDPKDLKARSRIGVMLQESGVPGMLRVTEIVDLFGSYYPSPLPTAKAIADASPAAIKAQVAGKRVTFTTTAVPDEGQLDGLPLSSKVIEGQRVRLLTNEPENVVRELFRRGVQVENLEVAGADLEEAFIAMTHREVHA